MQIKLIKRENLTCQGNRKVETEPKKRM